MLGVDLAAAFGLLKDWLQWKEQEPMVVEAVLANIDANRRHLVCRFAGHGSCSFCLLHPKSQDASRSTVGPSH